MNNLNPLYENIGMGIAGGAIGSIPGIVAGTMTYQAIVNHKRKSYCKQLLENMDLNSLLKEAYDCCESIYHTKGEYSVIVSVSHQMHDKLTDLLMEKMW